MNPIYDNDFYYQPIGNRANTEVSYSSYDLNDQGKW